MPKKLMTAQRGATLLELTISTALFGLLMVGWMKFDKTSSRNAYVDNTVDELNQLSNAAADYAARAAKSIIYGCDMRISKVDITKPVNTAFDDACNADLRSKVAVLTAPTILELRALSILPADFPVQSRLNNGTYKISITQRSECGMTGGGATAQCDMDILVWIDTPLKTGTAPADIDHDTAGRLLRILGDKAGFTAPPPGCLTANTEAACKTLTLTGFEERWIAPNPEIDKSGILALKTGYHTQLAATAMRTDGVNSFTGDLKNVTFDKPHYVISGLGTASNQVTVDNSGFSLPSKDLGQESEFKTAVVISGTSTFGTLDRTGSTRDVSISGATTLASTSHLNGNTWTITGNPSNRSDVTLSQSSPTQAVYTTTGTTHTSAAMSGDGNNMDHLCSAVDGVQPRIADGYNGVPGKMQWREQRSDGAGDYCVQWRRQTSLTEGPSTERTIGTTTEYYVDANGVLQTRSYDLKETIRTVGARVDVGQACTGPNCRTSP